MKVMEEKTETPPQAPRPKILLEQQDDGTWSFTSNVKNPERVLRLIGAQLVVRNEG